MELLPADDYQEQTLFAIADTIDNSVAQGISRKVRWPSSYVTNSYIPLIANYFAEHQSEVSIVSDEASRLRCLTASQHHHQALRAHQQPRRPVGPSLPWKKDCALLTTSPEDTPRSLYELVEQLFADLQLDRFDESERLCLRLLRPPAKVLH